MPALPLVRCCSPPLVFCLLSFFVGESEFLNQQLGGGVEKGAHVGFAYVGQLLALDRAGLATVPAVRTLGVRVLTEHHDLLAVGHDLDLCSTAVRRRECARDLLERFVSAQQDRTLWGLAEANQNIAALLKMFSRQRFDRVGGIRDA